MISNDDRILFHLDGRCGQEEEWHSPIVSESGNDCTGFTSDYCTKLDNDTTAGNDLNFVFIRHDIVVLSYHHIYEITFTFTKYTFLILDTSDINLQRFLIKVVNDIPSVYRCK